MKPEFHDRGTALTDAQGGIPRPRTIRGYLMLGLALVTCPCHLPILLVVLAGTAAGAYLRDNLFLSGIALTAAFLPSLMLGLRWIGPTGSEERNYSTPGAGTDRGRPEELHVSPIQRREDA